jgi:hypothetical protein
LGYLDKCEAFFGKKRSRLEFPNENSGIKIEEDWIDLYFLTRPVTAGMCSYESLKNGNITVEDLFEMHDALNLQQWIESKSNEEDA